jgi:murein DD-endopeptidase MepM/ murein hydrolase activator NlpD
VALKSKICYHILMLKVEVTVERPGTILVVLCMTAGLFFGLQLLVNTAANTQFDADTVGGQIAEDRLRENEEEIRRQRIEQSVLDRREEILRYQLLLLERRADQEGGTWSEGEQEEWRRVHADFLVLLGDRQMAEERIRTALYEIWESQGALAQAGKATNAPLAAISWPVDPKEGISATYLDPTYEETFGLPHWGIDIPVEQRSIVRAAADGIVETVADNGMGFSYLVVRHEGGATLYGHVSGFLVHEGDRVREGSGIAISGGIPGTPGAGPLSTGPHLHFEVLRNGMHVDPLEYLPQRDL